VLQHAAQLGVLPYANFHAYVNFYLRMGLVRENSAGTRDGMCKHVQRRQNRHLPIRLQLPSKCEMYSALSKS